MPDLLLSTSDPSLSCRSLCPFSLAWEKSMLLMIKHTPLGTTFILYIATELELDESCKTDKKKETLITFGERICKMNLNSWWLIHGPLIFTNPLSLSSGHSQNFDVDSTLNRHRYFDVDFSMLFSKQFEIFTQVEALRHIMFMCKIFLANYFFAKIIVKLTIYAWQHYKFKLKEYMKQHE